MTSSSWYRRGLWQFKGNREYTRSGYETASVHFVANHLEDIDCSGRHYMITGANSGIGLAACLEIARRGGILHLVCRNAKSMKEARSHIITTTGNDRIFQHQLNLDKPRDVVHFAHEFARTNDRLDVLVNNAGCMVHERVVDEDGIETSFAVNTLAVHILTSILLPLLQKSDDGRVITVSSAGMLTVKLDPYDLSFEKMQPFNGRLAYSQTKRQQVIMNLNYAQRYQNVLFFSMHPGWADTPSVQTALPEFYEAMKVHLRTPHQGADTVVWLAVSNAARKHASGQFFQDRVPVATHLPMAWTRSSVVDEKIFMEKLDEFLSKFTSVPLSSIDEQATIDNKHLHLSSFADDNNEIIFAKVSYTQEGSGSNSEKSHEVVHESMTYQISDRSLDINYTDVNPDYEIRPTDSSIMPEENVLSAITNPNACENTELYSQTSEYEQASCAAELALSTVL